MSTVTESIELEYEIDLCGPMHTKSRNRDAKQYDS